MYGSPAGWPAQDPLIYRAELIQIEVEKGVRRWVVDISQWNPSSHDFSRAISHLPSKEHTSISRYVKLEDRKRALVSSLLQYALVRQVLGISPNEIIIKRTAEGKPYLVSVARGHPRNAIESYKRALRKTEFEAEHCHLGLHFQNASFVQQTVEQVIDLLRKEN